MTKTLLDITQEILSDMSGDVVNSIFDTEDAEQVARIVVQTHQDIVSNSNWPATRVGLKLIGRSDNQFPTHMILPENIKEIISVKYDVRKKDETRKRYRERRYKNPDEFLVYLNHRNNEDPNVLTVVDDSGIELFIRNDKQPEYYTSFNDKDVIFDSFEKEVEDTLQSDKTQCLAFILPSLELDNSAIPQIPIDTFSFLIQESKTRCQFLIREFQDIVSAEEAGRQRRWVSRKAWKLNRNRRYPNYGRKSYYTYEKMRKDNNV